MVNRIELTQDVALLLEATVSGVGSLEFSGFGYVQKVNDALVIYDFELLNVGSEGFTEANAKDIYALMQREDKKNMKCWIHRHPVGNGKPGAHNWSATDHDTCRNAPLGSPPELVKWSCAIVRTPHGWVGRLDNHLVPEEKGTQHLPVFPEIHNKIIMRPWVPQLEKRRRQLEEERAKSHSHYNGWHGQYRVSGTGSVQKKAGAGGGKECAYCYNETRLKECADCGRPTCPECGMDSGKKRWCYYCSEEEQCAGCFDYVENKDLTRCDYCTDDYCSNCITTIYSENVCRRCQPSLF